MLFPKTNEELVDYLVNFGYIKSPRVMEAFLKVDRKLFVPDEYKEFAYIDEPLPIGYGQTISAPSVIALALEALDIKSTDKVLEIGTGSGYSTALLAELANKVVSIERIPELAKQAEERLKKLGYKNVKIIVGDGSKGFPEEAPYDKIVVWAAAKEIPKALVEQLREGGKLVIPVDNPFEGGQDFLLCEKKGGKLYCKVIEKVRFVPLIEE